LVILLVVIKKGTREMNANELAAELDKLHPSEPIDDRVITNSATMLRQQDAQIKLLESVLIKAKELLEQGEEVDFDDMMHVEILLEDAGEIRELIEKTLDKEKNNEDE